MCIGPTQCSAGTLRMSFKEMPGGRNWGMGIIGKEMRSRTRASKHLENRDVK